MSGPDSSRRNPPARLLRVAAYIEAHLELSLSVGHLSEVSGVSKYHFHREFSAWFGIPVSRYISLLRLKRASYQLAFRDTSVLDIALEAGYESHEAFSRAFRRALGQSPSAFRRQPDWLRWSELFSRREIVPQHNLFYKVDVVRFQQSKVVYLEHHGSIEELSKALRRFITWRRQSGLGPGRSDTFNIFPAPPEDSSADSFCLQLAAGTRQSFDVLPEGFKQGLISGGRYAKLSYQGSEANIEPAFNYLYRTWLPSSGQTLRDAPAFLQRLTFFPDVAEHQAEADLFLPLEE